MDKRKAVANRDPVTGAQGAHPIGTSVGALSGAVAGATLGSMAGPIGVAVGVAVGAMAGGLVGKGAVEAINSSFAESYWRDRYPSESFYTKLRTYEDYQPAFKVGFEGRMRHPSREFTDVEDELEEIYYRDRGESKVLWIEARHPALSAWEQATRTP